MHFLCISGVFRHDCGLEENLGDLVGSGDKTEDTGLFKFREIKLSSVQNTQAFKMLP